VDAQAVIEAILPSKDVDGFHPHNVGALATLKGPKPLFAPCTPLGCLELLDRLGVALAGARAVVVGRSNVVGLPLALLLLRRDATVTVCHSATRDMAAAVRDADVVLAAAGKAGLVRGEWLKPGAVVIDVGTNAVDDPSKKAGYRLVGDCDFEGCLAAEGALVTPVPGGVGPMTIAMLMRNTLEGARRALLPPPPGAREGE
jgi:5,10-methylene-tetrahydrofolate dehydrogenase/methenyl tetrahydrofolate cyclohydrolase